MSIVKDPLSLHSMVVSKYLKSTLAIFVDVSASAFVKVPMDLLPKRRSSGKWNAKSQSVFKSAKADRVSGPAETTFKGDKSLNQRWRRC